jgi:hypothetical protein
MSKHLRLIVEKDLSGVKSSKIRAGSTGNDPHVDYKPKTKSEQDFVDLHDTEEFEDRVGNPVDGVYKAKVKKAEMDRHGHEPKPRDKKVYQAANEETKTCKCKGKCKCGVKSSGDVPSTYGVQTPGARI